MNEEEKDLEILEEEEKSEEQTMNEEGYDCD